MGANATFMTITPCEVLKQRGGWWEDLLTDRCSFPIAPVNTFSNLAYVIAGVLVFLLRPTLASGVMGGLLVFLGVGSGLYHGTKELWASRLDNAGMYSTFSALVTYTLSPTHRFIGPLMAFVGTIVAWRLAYGSSWKTLLNPMMGVFVAISTISVALNGSLKSALLSFGLFGVAYLIWWADKRHTFWFPRWGHGIWHVLTAIALAMLFLGVV